MRALLVAILISTACVACTASKVDSNAAVTVHGTVQGADGQPKGGAPVVLAKEADIGDALLGTFLIGATIGTICLADPPPTICARAKRTTTAADGTYSFHLTGKDTQGGVGQASSFQISTGVGSGGASVSARFQIQKTDLALPVMKLWEPTVQVTVNPRTARANWAPRETAADEQVVFTDPISGATVWAADGRGTATFDARVLEDAKGNAAVESTGNADAGGTSYRYTYRSAPVPFTGSTGPPPSRGFACSPQPCSLTDGKYGTPATLPASAQEAIVTLDKSRPVELIVVRGCPGDCQVETSIDAQSWKLVGSGKVPFFSITPPLGPDVYQIRVRSGSDVSRMAEISVW